MSSRREARRKLTAATANGVPADLAAGPCIETWADPGAAWPLYSARLNWRAARDAWMREHGITGWHHLPPELRDRAPFHRPERITR